MESVQLKLLGDPLVHGLPCVVGKSYHPCSIFGFLGSGWLRAKKSDVVPFLVQGWSTDVDWSQACVIQNSGFFGVVPVWPSESMSVQKSEFAENPLLRQAY